MCAGGDQQFREVQTECRSRPLHCVGRNLNLVLFHGIICQLQNEMCGKIDDLTLSATGVLPTIFS